MENRYKKLTPAGVEHLRKITDPGRVYVGETIKKDYWHDEMPEYGSFQPEALVEVLTKEEVSAIMKYAWKENIPVVVRGGGTGLAGGAICSSGGIMISMLRMNRIDPVDRANMTISAEAGALLCDISKEASAVGLFYPPDPGERTASIGGTVITNAGGMRAVRYGVTRDYVRSIEGVLPDGEIVQFSSNVVKNTTGYDLKDLIIGSEGTLCICTKVTLRLLPLPAFTRTLVVPYADLITCIESVPKILQLNFMPTAVEFIEQEVLDMIGTHLNKPFPDNSGNAYLILMYDAASREELENACNQCADTCLQNGALDVKIADTPERIQSVWSVRAAVLEGLKAESDSQEECDVVVPRAEIANYIRAAKEIGRRYNIRIVTVGHAGDGNIHTEMLRKNQTDEEWHYNTKNCLKELYAKSKELGGQLSGEHGIGIGRIDYLEDFVGRSLYKLFQGVKKIFDEKNLLNPGKVIHFPEN
ncbi:MAG: FAD-binding oxidoreductase [Fusobacteriaceae bacterium]|jgi:glycolate oxidase|nr:FAD-binding oxidoreductase [Fusobacteriaceae bacterium]